MFYFAMQASWKETASENKEPFSRSVVPVTGRNSQPVQGTNLRRDDINKQKFY
jgi:hypothetical protein